MQLDPLVAALGGTHDVLTMEFAGHGSTPLGGAAFSVDGFVAQLVERFDRDGIERADVFGYSMGGYVALACALAYPERVRSVYTLGTKLAWTPEAAAEASRCDPGIIRERGAPVRA